MAPLEHEARRAATALYHLTTSVAMAWEATRLGDRRRMHLAQSVLRERLLARDPLEAAAPEPPWLRALPGAAPMAGDVGEVDLLGSREGP
jgi:hypothetical protein